MKCKIHLEPHGILRVLTTWGLYGHNLLPLHRFGWEAASGEKRKDESSSLVVEWHPGLWPVAQKRVLSEATRASQAEAEVLRGRWDDFHWSGKQSLLSGKLVISWTQVNVIWEYKHFFTSFFLFTNSSNWHVDGLIYASEHRIINCSLKKENWRFPERACREAPIGTESDQDWP